MRAVPRWVGTLALAAAAVQGTGCEIIYIAIAASADDDIVVDPGETTPTPLCARAADAQSRSFVASGTSVDLGYDYQLTEVQMTTVGRIPGSGIATADAVALFFTIPDENYDYESIADRDITFESSGDLGDIEWEVCPLLYNQAAVVLHASRPGAGSITVLDDGDELATFDLAVSEPSAMEIVFDEASHVLEARMTDDRGGMLYAGDVLWQIAPYTTQPIVYGNLALLDGGFASTPSVSGPPSELTVIASRGTMEARLKLGYDAFSATWHVIE